MFHVPEVSGLMTVWGFFLDKLYNTGLEQLFTVIVLGVAKKYGISTQTSSVFIYKLSLKLIFVTTWRKPGKLGRLTNKPQLLTGFHG
jgi:hypothetical protein